MPFSLVAVGIKLESGSTRGQVNYLVAAGILGIDRVAVFIQFGGGKNAAGVGKQLPSDLPFLLIYPASYASIGDLGIEPAAGVDLEAGAGDAVDDFEIIQVEFLANNPWLRRLLETKLPGNCEPAWPP